MTPDRPPLASPVPPDARLVVECAALNAGARWPRAARTALAVAVSALWPLVAATQEATVPLLGIPSVRSGELGASMVLDFGEDSVTISGIEPGGRVVLFAVARETDRHLTRLTRSDLVVEDDARTGIVTLDLERAVPPESIWIAVDLDSGATAVGAPEGSPWRELELPAVTTSGAGDIVELYDLLMAEVLLVRRKVGAWGLGLGDGGAMDALGSPGRPNGVIGLPAGAMWPIGDSPPPRPFLVPGDLLVVAAPQELRVAVVTLEPQGRP